jgi:hypothetical protein
MGRLGYDEAYPGIRFLPRSRNWWARLKGVPAECEHLDRNCHWMATLVPDTLYVQGKARTQRDPIRPEVSLCRECLLNTILDELAAYPGRVIAFEPDAESFSQYFFVESGDLEAAGVMPEVASAIQKRLDTTEMKCGRCDAAATWTWFSREDVASLDESERIGGARGEHFCAEHGAQRMCTTLQQIPEANVFYMNLPYGEGGSYLWI